MSITPQALRAITAKIARLEAQAQAKAAGPTLIRFIPCAPDGRLAAPLGAMEGGGFGIVGIASGKFLAGSAPQDWLPKPDVSGFAAAWDAHLTAAASAAAAGIDPPAFVPPTVVHRIDLVDAPPMPEVVVERLPVSKIVKPQPAKNVVPMRPPPPSGKQLLAMSDDEFLAIYGK